MNKKTKKTVDELANELEGMIVNYSAKEMRENSKREVDLCWRNLTLFDLIRDLREIGEYAKDYSNSDFFFKITSLVKSEKSGMKDHAMNLALPNRMNFMPKSFAETYGQGGAAMNDGTHEVGYEISTELTERHDFSFAFMASNMYCLDKVETIFHNLDDAYELAFAISELLPGNVSLVCEYTDDFGTCLTRSSYVETNEELMCRTRAEIGEVLKPWDDETAYCDARDGFDVFFDGRGFVYGRCCMLKVPAGTDVSFLKRMVVLKHYISKLNEVFNRNNDRSTAMAIVPFEESPCYNP